MSAQVKPVVEGAFAVDNLHFLSVQAPPRAQSGRPRTARVFDPAESDASYFSRRAGEERAFAYDAGNVLTRALHLELADRYAGLAAAIREADERIG